MRIGEPYDPVAVRGGGGEFTVWETDKRDVEYRYQIYLGQNHQAAVWVNKTDILGMIDLLKAAIGIE